MGIKGEVVDNIENNAFTVIENVETADEKLKSAHENQKSARKVSLRFQLDFSYVSL